MEASVKRIRRFFCINRVQISCENRRKKNINVNSSDFQFFTCQFTHSPASLQKLTIASNTGVLQAFIVVDGNPRIKMLIDPAGNGTASVTIPGLSRSVHDIVITYEYTDDVDTIILAQVRDIADLTSGSATLPIDVTKYSFEFDKDGDGVTNSTELLEGTDPHTRNSGPVIGLVALGIIADVPELIARAAENGTLRVFITLDDNGVQIDMPFDSETGLLSNVILPNIAREIHTFSITFEYTDSVGTLILAVLTEDVNLNFGGQNVKADPVNLDFASYDNDADGATNALEAAIGSDPRNKQKPFIAAELVLNLDTPKTFSFTWADVPDATTYRLLENIDGVSDFLPVGPDISPDVENLEHKVSLLAHLKARYKLQSCNDLGCTDDREIILSGSLGNVPVVITQRTITPFFITHDDLSGDGKTFVINTSPNISEGEATIYVKDENERWAVQSMVFQSVPNPNNADIFTITASFGSNIALSEDGNTLVVSASSDNNGYQGVNPDRTITVPIRLASGAIYIYTRNGVEWREQAYIKASNASESAFFGNSISLSDDGNTLLVGASGDERTSAGVGAAQETTITAPNVGAAYIFQRNSIGVWDQQVYIKANNSDEGDAFGFNVALSGDGLNAVISASGEDSSEIGIKEFLPIDDNSAINSGAVYVYTYDGTTWSQQAYIKASNAEAADGFSQVELSRDGNILVVSALGEDGGDRLNLNNNNMTDSGAVYIFERDGIFNNGVDWQQTDYIKPDNIDAIGRFGSTISLSGDANTLAIGDPNENSNSIGVGGDPSNKTHNSGAVYIFKRNNTWQQSNRIKSNVPEVNQAFGSNVLFSDEDVPSLIIDQLLY